MFFNTYTSDSFWICKKFKNENPNTWKRFRDFILKWRQILLFKLVVYPRNISIPLIDIIAIINMIRAKYGKKNYKVLDLNIILLYLYKIGTDQEFCNLDHPLLLQQHVNCIEQKSLYQYFTHIEQCKQNIAFLV